MDVYLLAFVGYILGAAGRTSYDYLFVLLENPDTAFDRKYIITALVSIIFSFMSAALVFPNLQLPTGSDFMIMLITFSQGFAANHGINKIASYLTKKEENSDG